MGMACAEENCIRNSVDWPESIFVADGMNFFFGGETVEESE